MTITTTFDPPLPSDSPAVFNAKAFTLLGDLNTWGDEANDLQADVNAKQATASAAATTATTQAGLATAAKNAAESAWDNFDDRYLGPKASNPTLDNDGNALLEGALYWNTAAKEMRTWNGTAWVTTSVANALSRTGDTMTGPLAQAAGTASLPSYTFSGSTSTGMWSPGADILAWSTAGAERLRIDASGNVGVGTGSPGTYGKFVVASTGPAQTLLTGTDTGNGFQQFWGATGRLGYVGYGDVSQNLYVFNDKAADIRFGTNGAERLRIDASGNVLVTGSGGLGYGAGSGGSVIQATSKSTGVTLNKPCGRIQTHGANLNAGDAVSFLVTNSMVGQTDTVTCNVVGGTGSTNAYIVTPFPQSGSFFLSIRNLSAVNLAEELQLEFNVHKGAIT